MTLALLHDLALLYLGLAHGADEELHPSETEEIAAKLRQWQPDKDPALIDHVIREATLTYMNGANQERLLQAMDLLKSSFSEGLLLQILHDLHDIARADGEVLDVERDFIAHVASSWKMDFQTEP